jgi:hypothetical protein
MIPQAPKQHKTTKQVTVTSRAFIDVYFVPG